MRSIALALFVLLAVACSSAPPWADKDRPAKKAPRTPKPAAATLDEALANPPASGLLVTSVQPDTQAARLGILAGDIIVSYAGQPTPDMPALNAAVSGAEGDIVLTVMRGAEERSFDVDKGRIGVALMPVVAGQASPPLPRATVKSFDFTSLADEPRDEWFAFYRGDQKTGYGRIRSQIVGDRLVVLTEEVFEDSTRLYDHEVTCVSTSTGIPTLRMTCFRDRMNDWERFGTACVFSDDEFKWTVISRGPGSEDEAFQDHIGTGVIPAYMMETIVSFMPREKDACFRFTPLYEGSGRVSLPCALVCTGEESMEIDGKLLPTWRYEWRQLGGESGTTFWVDRRGHLVRASYGEIHVERSAADRVKDGQPESILSR